MKIEKKGFKKLSGSHSTVFFKAEIECKELECFTISFKENVGIGCSEKTKDELIKRFKSYAEQIEKIFTEEKEKETKELIEKMAKEKK